MKKIMIASDIHGDAETTKTLLDAFLCSGCEKLVLLGDILYHGPRNDLPAGYAPKAVIELLNPLADKILAVRGNCDTEVDRMVLAFPILADYAYICIGKRSILATHGHVFNLDSLPPMSEGEILLHGHTHVPAARAFGRDNLYLNPGSVSIPKEGSAKSYMIIDGNEAMFFELYTGKEYNRVSL